MTVRNPPALITPPGSNPALGRKHSSLFVPPPRFNPFAPTKMGSPGFGPGVAVADHVHPLQPDPEPAVGNPLLAQKYVTGLGIYSLATANPTQVDIDPANLFINWTAPASGKVCFEIATRYTIVTDGLYTLKIGIHDTVWSNAAGLGNYLATWGPNNNPPTTPNPEYYEQTANIFATGYTGGVAYSTAVTWRMIASIIGTTFTLTADLFDYPMAIRVWDASNAQ